jgi:hypothetical protein
MNPREERAAARLRDLIDEGESVAALERPSSVGPFIQDQAPLNAWLVKVDNIVESVFGSQSAHYRHLAKALDRTPSHAYEVQTIVGVLTGALDDLEGGYLAGQEDLIAAELLDTVLEQGRLLVSAGYKDPAVVLARVALEDALRRVARQEGVDDSGKASAVNDALRDSGRNAKPQWRLIQAWLDMGNSAAHGDFDAYSAAEAARLIDDVERFVAQELHAATRRDTAHG